MAATPPASLLSAQDECFLEEALALAQSAIGLSEPNPRVGCVIGLPTGQVLGRGFTQRAGEAHAEVMALRDAAGAARAADAVAGVHAARGATAWVTLEPCAHHGRTPPCCDALIAAGIARVVIAVTDPFAAVNGQGVAQLRAAGVEVVVADPASRVAQAARELNIGFFSRVVRERPWVRMKIAASLDGRTALANGRSQWITGTAARADGHAFRKRAGAVLTGIGTVLEDDPRLDVREVGTVLQPQRVVVDSRLQTPASARILQPPGRVWLYAGRMDDASLAAERVALEASGMADIRALPDAQGKVDLAAMLHDLAARGINELHVEAGHKLNASLLRAGLVDELLVYLAPRLIGLGREMAAFGPIEALADTLDFRFTDVAMVGDDLRIRARPHGRERF